MINFDFIIVILVILFILVSLYKEFFGAAFTFIIAIVILGTTRVLTPAEILGGFANEQIVIILMLLMLGDIFRRTSLLDVFFDKLFSKIETKNKFLFRMMSIVSILSAFLNNTPLVALLMPYVHNWGKRHGIAISKLLIPLSFAAILGGCATLIGTSTNLIVNGLVIDQKIIPKLQPLQMFDFVAVGLPMIFIGILYLFFASKLLPDNTNVIDDFSQNARKYIVEVLIKTDCDLVGKTIKQAQLKDTDGLILHEIIRNNYQITDITPDTILYENDLLLFSGDTDTIADLVNANPSLVIPSIGMFSKKRETDVVEIVISHNSSLTYKKIDHENFRRKYDSTVLAIHRNGENIKGKIGEVVLKAGDALLLLSGNQFKNLARRTTDFYPISKVKEIKRLGIYKGTLLLGGSALIILLSALGIIKLFTGLLILLTTMVMTKITTQKALTNSIDYSLAIIIALSLALGVAMIKTGVAAFLAQEIIDLFVPLGNVGMLTGIYFITSILAAYVTNKAAVAIVFPISLTLANDLQLPPLPFILVVSFAAAANFMTPIGYQTNLMIYGPGGYKFNDFFKIGAPLTLIYMVVTITILNYIYF